MFKTNAVAARPFGREPHTEIRLLGHRLVSLTLRAGDRLRSDCGLVWATVDGEAADVLLDRGEVHVVARDCTMQVSAFGSARLELLSQGPRQPAGAGLAAGRMRLIAAWQTLRRRLHRAIAGVRPLGDAT